MGKHLQKSGFTPDYTVWTFHGESAQRDRAEVDHRRTDEHGTGMENMVQGYDDARGFGRGDGGICKGLQ